MTSLTIVIKGKPIAQARHRTRIVQPREGKPFTQNYTPKKVKAWREYVLFEARRTKGFPREPWDGNIRLSMDAYFERPKRLLKASSPEGPIPYTQKPDADNLSKAVMDALTPPRLKRGRLTGNRAIDEAIRRDARSGYLWLDDSQVQLGPIERWYAAKGCGPGLVITVERIPETRG